jgi:hypothetical protein
VERGGAGCYREPKEGCKEELGIDEILNTNYRIHINSLWLELRGSNGSH